MADSSKMDDSSKIAKEQFQKSVSEKIEQMGREATLKKIQESSRRYASSCVRMS